MSDVCRIVAIAARLATAGPQGMLRSQTQLDAPAKRRETNRLFPGGSFREVSEYSTFDPELAREAVCSRHHPEWHRLKTGRDQIPH